MGSTISNFILYPINHLRRCRLKPGYGSATHSLRKDDRSLPAERSKEASARRHKTRLRLYEISRDAHYSLIFSSVIDKKVKLISGEMCA